MWREEICIRSWMSVFTCRTGLWWQDAAVSPGTGRDTQMTNHVAGTWGSGPADGRQATRLPDGSDTPKVPARVTTDGPPIEYRTLGETKKNNAGIITTLTL